MARNTLNLSALLQRLGIKGAEGTYNLIEALQPTLIAGDVSGLVPTPLPPLAWFGFSQGAVAGQLAGFKIKSRAPGGTYIRTLSANRVASTDELRFANFPGATDPAPGFAGLTARNFDQNNPVEALCFVGTQAASPFFPTFQAPLMGVAPNGAIIMQDVSWIPAGDFFYAELTVANNGLQFGVLVQDVPVSLGAE